MISKKLYLDSDVTEIYVISDIHSNVKALSSVLQQIRKDALIFCTGDIVGYYNKPNEVCEMLQRRGVHCIRGNHDDYVLSHSKLPHNADLKYKTSWTSRELTSENTSWLRDLPDRLDLLWNSPELPSGKVEITFVHGSIFSNEDRLYPDTDLSPYIFENSDVFIGGHTHHPMSRTYGNKLFMNPGSVGQPRDRIPGASFAKLSRHLLHFELQRCLFDVAELQKDLQAEGFPQETIDMLVKA